jgi:hypothetical protein
MHKLDSWRLRAEPFYQAAGDELEAFLAAHAARIPLLLTFLAEVVSSFACANHAKRPCLWSTFSTPNHVKLLL